MLRKKEERKDQRRRQTTFLDPFLSFILGRALHMTPSFFLLARRESFFYHSWTPLSFPQPSFLNASITPFSSPLNGSITPSAVTPAIFKPFLACPWMLLSGVHGFKKSKKKQKRGFPIKNFGNDGGGKPSTEDSTYSSPLWGVRVRVVFAIL